MKKVIAALIGGYMLTCAVLFLLQDRLLFFPSANDRQAAAALADREWSLMNGDVRLTGWSLERADAEHLPLIIYFGGNAQDVSHRARLFRRKLMDANFLFVNYRGYGSSGGTPGEREMLADALVIYERATKELSHNGRIVAWGRSLGSGVATYLAAERELAGVILVTPFDSVLAVAKASYGYLPVQWLLRHPFDSIERAPRITVPALVFIAGRDRIVPPHHAERLVAAWGGETQVVRLPSATHSSIGAEQAFFAPVESWLARFQTR